MGLFTPRDPQALLVALGRGSLEDFLAVYRRRFVAYETSLGTLLEQSLRNSDLEHGRVPIAHRLLDDGADPRRGHPLHVLLGQRKHDVEREPALVQRMLDLGADVNGPYPGRGARPLETLASVFAIPERELVPYYDVLFARDDLDLRAEGEFGVPVVEVLRRWVEHRPELVRRAEAHLARGARRHR
ncbi:hypothetical protein [uncultured Nocardioides sp.]|uniref:hypothetical protein n=1 Tax=uncultured Nocardioides sp. TaxID=198441 RepID=UPI002631E68D|nr:hypothetical protein [uncultured Nocardioides sp.]